MTDGGPVDLSDGVTARTGSILWPAQGVNDYTGLASILRSINLTQVERQFSLYHRPLLCRWPAPMDDATQTYPNRLRETREQAFLTREQLAGSCRELARLEPHRYKAVSLPAIKRLEQGLSRPRRSTAFTLAQALGSAPEDLFPNGFDTAARNPKERTV